MSVKVIKKGPELNRKVERELIRVIKSDIADIKRRVNGILKPIEDKITEWERLEKLLS